MPFYSCSVLFYLLSNASHLYKDEYALLILCPQVTLSSYASRPRILLPVAERDEWMGVEPELSDHDGAKHQ